MISKEQIRAGMFLWLATIAMICVTILVWAGVEAGHDGLLITGAISFFTFVTGLLWGNIRRLVIVTKKNNPDDYKDNSMR